MLIRIHPLLLVSNILNNSILVFILLLLFKCTVNTHFQGWSLQERYLYSL